MSANSSDNTASSQQTIGGQEANSAAGAESSGLELAGVGREYEIYTRRFSPEETAARGETWDVLVEEFLQDYIPESAAVVDIGAGDGYFISRIKAGRRIAVDMSSHVELLREEGIEVHRVSACSLSSVLDDKVDAVFMSNFLEHLPNKKMLLDILSQCKEALKPEGKLIILQPNIRYAGSAYWDYIDHHIALTEHSLTEALEVTGFNVQVMIPRFLPYTAKSRVGRLANIIGTKKLVSIYLKVPLLWRIFGKQTFVVARPRIV